MKTTNSYARALGTSYERCPKAVLAAIAVSALTCGGEHLDEAASRVREEWALLFANGIIPQKPPASP